MLGVVAGDVERDWLKEVNMKKRRIDVETRGCSQSLSLTDSHGARTIAITINVDGTGHDLQVSNIEFRRRLGASCTSNKVQLIKPLGPLDIVAEFKFDALGLGTNTHLPVRGPHVYNDIIRSGMYQCSPICKDWLRLMLASAHLDVLHPHVHRFQKFCLHVANGTDLQTALPPLFGSGMPLLEGLRFTGAGPGDNNLDIHLTSKRFPSLRTLLLTRTMAPRDISLYAQLRTLELKLCHHTLSFEGFLDALAASVQLEELSIYETLSSLSSEDPTWAHGGPVFRGPPAVLLPALRQFTLIGNSIARTSRFLAHLQFQPCAVLDICADVPRPGPGPGVASPNTALSFSAMLPPNPSATFPSLAFATAVCMRIEGGNCELRYDPPSPIVDSPDCPSESPYVALFLELHRSQWGPFMATGLGDVVRTFGRSPLTCLVVEGNHTYGTAAARERIFRTFPLLEELNVGGHPPSDVAVVFRGLHAASTSTSVSMMDGTPWARSPVRTSSAFMLQE
ncbi:hypothetical protein V8D89_000650 [Ganoderma adspersum]